MRRKRDPRSICDPKTPEGLRVYVGEGHKLQGEPSRKILNRAIQTGHLIRKTGKRIKLPCCRDTKRFWFRAENWDWYLEELNRQEGLNGR